MCENNENNTIDIAQLFEVRRVSIPTDLTASPDFNATYTHEEAIVLAALTKREIAYTAGAIGSSTARMNQIKNAITTGVFADTTTKHTADSRAAAINTALDSDEEYQSLASDLLYQKQRLALLEANNDFYRYVRQAIISGIQLRYARAAEEYGIN